MNNIVYRRVTSLTNTHIKAIKDKESNFCATLPYMINVNLGSELHILLSDGEYIIDVIHWTGVGIGLSKSIEPSDVVKKIVEKYLFY